MLDPRIYEPKSLMTAFGEMPLATVPYIRTSDELRGRRLRMIGVASVAVDPDGGIGGVRLSDARVRGQGGEASRRMAAVTSLSSRTRGERGRDAVDHDVMQLEHAGAGGAVRGAVARGRDRAAMHAHDQRRLLVRLVQADGDGAGPGLQLGVDDVERAAGLDAGAHGAVARHRIAEVAAPDDVVARRPDARAELAGIRACSPPW